MADSRIDALKEESIPALLRELSAQTTTLIRQEIALAKVEMTEKARAVSAGAGFLGAGALFAVGTFAALTVVLIAALALTIPLWTAALVVTIIYFVAALIAIGVGRSKISSAGPTIPQQTAETIQEDVEWVKTRARSNTR